MNAVSLILVFSMAVMASCSLSPSSKDMKNNDYNVSFSKQGWNRMDAGNADHAFMNSSTSSSIISNNLCGRYQNVDLDQLVNNLLAGIDDLIIDEKKENAFAGREGRLAFAHGAIDGVPVFLRIQSMKRNHCTYDFVLIQVRSNDHHDDERAFQEFLDGLAFH